MRIRVSKNFYKKYIIRQKTTNYLICICYYVYKKGEDIMKRTMMCFTFIFFVLSLFISSGKPMARDHNAIILEEYTSYEINEKYIQVNTDSNFLDTKEIKFDFQDIIKQYSIVENNYHYYCTINSDFEMILIKIVDTMTHKSLKKYNAAYLNKKYLEINYYKEGLNSLHIIYGEIDNNSLNIIKGLAIDEDLATMETLQNIAKSKSIITYFMDKNAENHINNSISDITPNGFEFDKPPGSGGGGSGNPPSNPPKPPSNPPSEPDEPEEILYSNSKKSIELYEYDDYTNNDYKATNYCYSNECGPVNSIIYDDPIIEIIPKELFTEIGTYTYVGDEYGFFIHTKLDIYALHEGSYYSDVLVFDIEKELPPGEMEKNTTVLPNAFDFGYVYIEPLFRYRYQTRFYENDSTWYTHDACGYHRRINPYSTTYVTLHSDYDYANLAISQPGVSVNILNVGEKNKGDVGYNIYDDYGQFISNIRLNDYQAYSETFINDNRLDTTIKYLLGFVPFEKYISGGILFALDTGHFLYDFINPDKDKYPVNVDYKTQDELNMYNRWSDQIKKEPDGYGTVIKNVKFKQPKDIEFTKKTHPDNNYHPANGKYPIIYQPFSNPNNYVRFRYELGGREGDLFDTKIAIGVHVEIVSYYPAFIDIDPISSLDAGYGTYFAKRDLKYDNSSSMRIDTINRDSKDMEINRIYSYNLDEHENTIYLCYEPTFTDTYYIETSGTNNISLFYKVKETNPQTNLDWTLKRHANGYNSLNVNLIGGRIYYIMITNNSKTNKSIDISITR